MSRKTVVRLTIILIILIIVVFLDFLIDVNCVIDSKEPVFSIKKDTISNVDSYIGPGYKIYKIYDENGNMVNIKFGSIFSTTYKILGDE